MLSTAIRCVSYSRLKTLAGLPGTWALAILATAFVACVLLIAMHVSYARNLDGLTEVVRGFRQARIDLFQAMLSTSRLPEAGGPAGPGRQAELRDALHRLSGAEPAMQLPPEIDMAFRARVATFVAALDTARRSGTDPALDPQPRAAFQDLDESIDAMDEVVGTQRDQIGLEEDQLFWMVLAISALLLSALVVVMVRVNHQQRAVAAARAEITERFTQIAENIQEVFWLTDLSMRKLIYVSPGYDRIWGRSVDALLAVPGSWRNAIHPEDLQIFARAATRNLTEGTYDIEYRILRPDGEIRWIRDRAFPVRDAAGALIRVAGVAEDITERKLAQSEIYDSRQRLRMLIEHAPAALAMFDRSMRCVAASRRWVEYCKLSDEQVLGVSAYDVFPEIPGRWKAVHARCMTGEIARAEEEYFDSGDGTAMWLRWEVHPWYGLDGKIGGTSIFTEDITARKLAELAREESEARFRQIVDNMREVFWLTSTERHGILYVSPGYEAIWGRTCADLYASPMAWMEAIHPDDRERVRQAALQDQTRGGYDIEYRIVRPGGEHRWIHDRAFPVRDAEGRIFRIAGVAEDVTEQRRSQEFMLDIAHGVAGETGTEFFRSLVTNLARYTQAEWVTVGELIDGGTRIRDVAQRSVGLPASRREFEVTGRPCERVLRDGSIRVWMDGVAEAFPGDQELAANGMRSFAGVPLFGPEREPIGVVSIISRRPMEDRTRVEAALQIFAARAQAELLRLQREREVLELNVTLEQRVRERTARMETAYQDLEAFSYSVSHDLRAPLRAIEGFLQVVVEEGPLNAPQREAFDSSVASAGRMSQLINDLMALAKVDQHPLQRASVDLAQLAREVVVSLREREPSRQVVVSFKVAMAFADSQLLRVALENLLGNAWKFTGKKTGAIIEFGMERTDNGTPVYYVRDNGAGFDPRYATRLFAPFQRLHAAKDFEGTGIGLATVQRIVRRHGGRIWATAASGEGATFRFTLSPDSLQPSLRIA